MAKKIKKEVKQNSKDDSRGLAFLATFLSIIGFIIVLLVKRKDKYVMFYAKQSLVVFIAAIIAGAIGWLVFWIPILGWIIRGGLNIIILILWIISWVYALSGKEKETPLIGKFAKNISL